MYTFVLLGIFVGLADMLGGYDRYIYSELFDHAADDITKGLPVYTAQVFDVYSGEAGFGWYNIIMAYITPNRYIFILITTLIIYTLLYLSIRQYCNNYPFAVILFMGLWFFFTFTYLRQVLGATIVWLGIRYIADRKLWKFILVWFIAYKFHNSAIVFLPMYFIPIKKYNEKLIVTVMFLIFILGLTGLPSILFDAYGEIETHVRANAVDNETGFRIAYFVEAAFFLYFILSKYSEIPEKPLNLVLLNMGLIFCAILLFFIKNENGGRLSWYYMIGIISTITYLATHTKRNKRFAHLMIFVSFTLYMRIAILFTYMINPYKSFLTNGIRKYDPVEKEYEYDHNYDRNKFYRPIFRSQLGK